jgi:hypothetical protein
LSALDRSNHRHPAERSQFFIGIIQQLSRFSYVGRQRSGIICQG